jgi:hypothetical protein
VRIVTKTPAKETPWEDPIVAEVRRARAELFASVGNDLDALARRLRKEQAASGRRVVARKPRRADGTAGEAA